MFDALLEDKTFPFLCLNTKYLAINAKTNEDLRFNVDDAQKYKSFMA